MHHIYAALVLRAAGRPVTAEGVAAVVASVGVAPQAETIRALVHLCEVLAPKAQQESGAGGAAPAEAPPPPPVATSAFAVAPPLTPLSAAAPVLSPAPGPGGSSRCYVYGVVRGADATSLAWAGVGGGMVYAVTWEDLAALVHDWPEGASLPEDEDQLRQWAAGHVQVLDRAMEQFGAVLPVALGRLIGKEGEDPRQVVRGWLQENAPLFRDKLGRLAGKREYALRVSWDPETVAARLAEENPELGRLTAEIREAPPGQAYLLQEKYRHALRAALETAAAECRKKVLERVRGRVADCRVEQPREIPGQAAPLLSLALLAEETQIGAVGEALAELQEGEQGLAMQLTGPWPPYSFAA